jgi:2-polyprenyl-3-methyl-5-hydroxy-6-metoxy-1,4-benzoquinol methylase
MKMEKVSCFLCGSDNASKIFRIDVDKEAPFDLVKCKKCQMTYMNPRFNENEIKDFYGKDYFIFDDIKNIRQLIYAQNTISDIKRFKNKGKLLDIGSAKGLFLLVAKKHGFNVEGLEISEYAANFTKDVFGIETKIGRVENVDLPENEFDIITMFDVIEHFQNPKESLKKIKSALKDDGILVIDTPNIESIYSRFRGSDWGGFGKFHLHYFSKATLTRLLWDVGFNPILVTSRKINTMSLDALWRWGITKYRIYIKLENKLILSKLSREIHAPVKKLYEEKKYNEIRKIIERQLGNIQSGKSVVMRMQNILNYPVNGLLDRMIAGDALRVIAKKK